MSDDNSLENKSTVNLLFSINDGDQRPLQVHECVSLGNKNVEKVIKIWVQGDAKKRVLEIRVTKEINGVMICKCEDFIHYMVVESD